MHEHLTGEKLKRFKQQAYILTSKSLRGEWVYLSPTENSIIEFIYPLHFKMRTLVN